jgi:RNA ligase
MEFIKKLESYYDEGLLYKQFHPTLPLIIWNYSEVVQYESKWDEITLQCRGLITDDKGNIIVKPMKKFFNYEEVVYDCSNLIPWKDEYDYIQNKEDGSMLILFHYLPTNEWVTATRGSFTSEQAIEGMNILNSKYKLEAFEKSIAYIGEVIYPQNRIVVDYGDLSTVKFITAVPNRCYNHDYYEELHFTTAMNYFRYSGIKNKDIVKTKQYFTFGPNLPIELKSLNTKNKEGFIFRFHPSNFRMKIKFEEYIRLHRIMTNCSTTSVWEALSMGMDIDDIIKDVPDEFYDKVKDYIKELRYQYHSIKEHAGKYFDNLYESYNGELPEKAKYAEWVKQFDRHLHPILFRMYDNKDYSKIIWRLIKPKFKKL